MQDQAQAKVVKMRPRPKARTEVKPKPKRDPVRGALVYTMSGVLPLLAVAGTKIAGTLAIHEHGAVASLVGLVVACVFSVSLRHCAQAIRSVIHAPPASAWILAIAFDLAVVSAEVTETFAPELSLHGTCVAVMVGIGFISAALNYLSFRSYR